MVTIWYCSGCEKFLKITVSWKRWKVRKKIILVTYHGKCKNCQKYFAHND